MLNVAKGRFAQGITVPFGTPGTGPMGEVMNNTNQAPDLSE
jgi:hypothetical protein